MKLITFLLEKHKQKRKQMRIFVISQIYLFIYLKNHIFILFMIKMFLKQTKKKIYFIFRRLILFRFGASKTLDLILP